MSHECRDAESHDQWGVMQCECELLRVKLGTVVLELEPKDLLRLIDMLDRAVDHFALDAPVLPQDSRAH